MLGHCLQNLIRAVWVFGEEPVLAKRVMNCELVTGVLKVYPAFGDVIGKKTCERCTREGADVIPYGIPVRRCPQGNEAARAVFHDLSA